MRALRWALGAAIVAGLGVGVYALLELRAQTLPPTPTAYVQAAWSVYRFAPGHRQHVGKLKLECAACHGSTTAGAFDRPGPEPCLGCHKDRSAIEHALVTLDAAGRRAPLGSPSDATQRQVSDCIACHGFGPDPDKLPTDCLSCHIRAQGDAPPIQTHADSACGGCHQVHDNLIAPAACTSCHSSIDVVHTRVERPVAQQCLDCHTAHGLAASATERCRDCHAQQEQSTGPAIPATATPNGHTCGGCHTPHTFTKTSARACASCHTQVHALDGKGHKECTACHAPHAVRESVRGNVCVSCHKTVDLQHTQAIEPAEACTSCHAAHPTKGAPDVASCGSCHQRIGAQGTHAHAGKLECTTCHAPHGFELSGGQTECARCHASPAALVAKNKGHAECANCHANLPHGEQLTPASCVSCHKAVRPSQGHSVCTNCHEPHSGKGDGKPCSTCHAPQASAAIHVNVAKVACTSCHEQHSGALEKGVADCTGCHNLKKLPGRHDVPQHAANCGTCHQAHGSTPPGARATCLSCHTDRHNHQPEANQCQGCHQFVSAPGAKKGGVR